MPGTGRRSDSIQSEQRGNATSCHLQTDSAALQRQGILSGWWGHASRSLSRSPHPRKGKSGPNRSRPNNFILLTKKRFPPESPGAAVE
jgi:hypothetical protein